MALFIMRVAKYGIDVGHSLTSISIFSQNKEKFCAYLLFHEGSTLPVRKTCMNSLLSLSEATSE